MRLFCELVYEGYISGTNEVRTASKYNDLLGRADEIVYEVTYGGVTGSSPTVTVAHYHSSCNDGTFPQKGVAINAVSIGSGTSAIGSVSGPLAAYGQAGIQLGGTTPAAQIRLYATGRGTGRG